MKKLNLSITSVILLSFFLTSCIKNYHTIQKNIFTMEHYLNEKNIIYILGQNVFLNKDQNFVDTKGGIVSDTIVRINIEKVPLTIATIGMVHEGFVNGTETIYMNNNEIKRYVNLNNIEYLGCYASKSEGLDYIYKNCLKKIGKVAFSVNKTREFVYIGNVFHGKFNGIIRQFSSGRMIAELCYENGKLNGVSKFYTLDGKTAEENTYKDDVLNGITKEYIIEPGNYVRAVVKYQNGIKEGIEIGYDRYGDRSSVQFYKNGVLEGDAIGYYEGKPHWFYKYVNGELEGKEYTLNLKTGKIIREGNYVCGARDGIEKFYYEDGFLLAETIWDKGKELNTIGYDRQGKKRFLIIHVERKTDIKYWTDENGNKLKVFSENESKENIYNLGRLLSGKKRAKTSFFDIFKTRKEKKVDYDNLTL
jgi:antitoxin component YwqK of YwqJK toxin-antitoxin module